MDLGTQVNGSGNWRDSLLHPSRSPWLNHPYPSRKPRKLNAKRPSKDPGRDDQQALFVEALAGVWMALAPMPGDVEPARHPHIFLRHDVVEEPLQADSPRWMAY